MTIANRGEITQLLVRWSEGDRAALDLLTPVIYREMRKLAVAHLRNERNGHTLQPTALTATVASIVKSGALLSWLPTQNVNSY
jgi:hypothetical protein